MVKRTILAVLVLVAACRDGVSPDPDRSASHVVPPQGAAITLDQQNDVFEWDPWGPDGTHIGKILLAN